MNVELRYETLTDGSKVYNVYILDGDQLVEFNCVTQDDAMEFERELNKLIRKHTNQ